MKTIQGKILSIFLAFLLTGIINLLVVIFSSQAESGIVINISGRQRMLSQKMSKESLILFSNRTPENIKQLKSTRDLFHESLNALIDGNSKLGISKNSDPLILRQLSKVQSLWNTFDSKIDSLLRSNDQEAMDYILQNNAALLREMNGAVVLYEKKANDSVAFMRYLNIAIVAFFVFAILISWQFIVMPVIRLLKNSIEKAVSIADSISADSTLLQGASEELAVANSQQATALEQSSSALEELTQTLKTNSSFVAKSSDASSEVEIVSQQGTDEMENISKSMEDILLSNNEIQELVNVIGEIAQKTAIIDEIVFQTKLLSFNASVEAERAGEHGRGFAVVAQEVGNLAQMSGKAALEISTIVKDSLSRASSITSENQKRVDVCNKQVITAKDILVKIKENASSVVTALRHIKEASEEQAVGVSEINKTVTVLDEVTSKNVGLSNNNATQSRSLLDRSVELQEIAHKLETLVR